MKNLIFLFLFFYGKSLFAYTDMTKINSNDTKDQIIKKIGIPPKEKVILPLKFYYYKDKNKKNTFVLHKFWKCYVQKNYFCRDYVNRSFSFLQFNASHLGINLSEAISLKTKKKTKALEIGFGEGRIMLELLSRYKNLEITGINKGGKHDFGMKKKQKKKEFNKLVKFYDIKNYSKVDIYKRLNYIYKDISNGELSMFPDKTFDFIYSLRTIRYLKNKKKLFKELWRILKDDGFAILDLELFFIMNKEFKEISLEKYFTTQFSSKIIKYDSKRKFLLLKKMPSYTFDMKLSPLNLKSYNFTNNLGKSDPKKKVTGWHSYYIYEGKD